MTPAGRRAAEDVGVGWFDLAGNAHLAIPGAALVEVEGRPRRARPRGRPATAFSQRGSRVSRALLIEPERHWTQKELVAATALAQGTVSRVLARLVDIGLVTRDDESRYSVPAPGELLDAWRDEYECQRHEILPMHLTGAGVALAREVAGRIEGIDVGHALTGLAAAWLYDGFAQFRVVSVFVDENPYEVAEKIGARMDPRGANVHLIRPADEGVFFGSREVDGPRCVHPVQAYLDLGGLPERADEAAKHLREKWIHW